MPLVVVTGHEFHIKEVTSYVCCGNEVQCVGVEKRWSTAFLLGVLQTGSKYQNKCHENCYGQDYFDFNVVCDSMF
jgi:hypothetical protein